MTAFGKALSAMFGDPNMGTAALYRQFGVGAGVAVRAARYSPSGTSAWAQGQIVAEGEQIEVSKADVPDLAERDTFEIDGVTWVVSGDPERGGLDMTWVAPVERAF